METGFIASLTYFLDYCERYKNQGTLITGLCRDCRREKKCLVDNKEMQIDALAHMDYTESRFPRLLKHFNNKPGIYYYVPTEIYKKAYGLYHKDFECPFKTEPILNHLNDIKETYSYLNDEESKKIFIDILMYRLTLDRDFAMKAYSSDPQYFIPEFRGLNEHEVYVDCGAFNGDSFCAYCSVNKPPNKAFLFEPDEKNICEAERKLQKYQEVTDIHFIGKAVYDHTGKKLFVNKNSQASHLSESDTKGIALDVITIDDAVETDISFLKMDIEGSEKHALIGARRHIVNNYPRLAICIYHRISDFWEIPQMIRKEFPDYTNYAVRHHTKNLFETVLYVWK